MQQTYAPQKRRFRRGWGPLLIWLLLLIYICFFALKLLTYPQVYSYLEGRCTITANLTVKYPGRGGNHGTPTRYHPEYGFTLHTADGQIVQTKGFDWFTTPVDSYEQGVNFPRYSVGQSIPCWYNPHQPSQVVLTRDANWEEILSQVPLLTPIAALILGGIFFGLISFSLFLLSPIIQVLTPGYWNRKERALQSLMTSPTSLTPTPADTIPPEVFALAASNRLGTPVEEYVQYPKRLGFGCLLVITVPLFSLIFFVLVTLALAILAYTQGIVLNPMPAWMPLLVGFLLIFSLVAGVVFFVLATGPTLHKRQQADILYRFARAELFYTSTYGLLWIKQGKVTAAYPWHMVQNVTTDLNARGLPSASWLYLTDGSRYTLYPGAVPLVQRGLIHYRQARP
jgi:hypothetical protein